MAKIKDVAETTTNHIHGDSYLTFYSSDKKWIRRLLKLKKQYPDKIDIRHDDPDEGVLAYIPENWFRLSPPRKISDAQRDAARDRMREYHKRKDSVLQDS